MGVGDQTRDTITPQQRRRAYIAKVREIGFDDGFYLGHPVADKFGDDPELRAIYLTGARLGKEQREALGGDAA